MTNKNILSVFNSITGKFDYYQCSNLVAINNEYPTPRLHPRESIGIAASIAGRPLPPEAVKVGEGTLPVGSISNGKRGTWTSTQSGSKSDGIGFLNLEENNSKKVYFGIGFIVTIVYFMYSKRI